MSRTSIAYAFLVVVFIGAVVYAGLVKGAMLGFGGLLLILAYRQYTAKASETKPVSKVSKKVATPAAPKVGSSKTAPKKPAKAPPKKLPTFGGTGSPSARPTAPVQTKPSTWKAPPRR